MPDQRRLQVVLGEAERDDGLLRFVLEAEGFDLVGLASSDEELARVLRGARPSVVVLDGGISATAALDARKQADGAALVVVWPEGVSAVLAEERVEPHMAIEDLGDAVRRAVDRTRPRQEPIRIPEAAGPMPLASDASVAEERIQAPPRRRTGRRAQVVVAAATWMLVITALTAIATAVPNALDLFSGPEGERPSPTPPVGHQIDEGDTLSGPEGEGQPSRCDTASRRNDSDRGTVESNGEAGRAQGCPPEHGTDERGNNAGGGPPVDPASQGKGSGSSSGTEGNGGASGDAQAEHEGGEQDQDVGGGEGNGDPGGGDTQKEHGRASEAARNGENG
jgi:hypothetical protein